MTFKWPWNNLHVGGFIDLRYNWNEYHAGATWWCDLGNGGPPPPPPQVGLQEYYGTSTFISNARLHCVQWGVQRGPGWLGAQPGCSEEQRYRITWITSMLRWINTYWIRIYWPDRTEYIGLTGQFLSEGRSNPLEGGRHIIPVRRLEQPFERGRHIFEYFPLVPGSPRDIIGWEAIFIGSDFCTDF